MPHGSPCGNIFASPSASQVYSVARNAENGGGVILGFGNYAGDVLHFGGAAEKLRAEGIDVRIIKVSDDIVSNTPANHRDRRGIAGRSEERRVGEEGRGRGARRRGRRAG